MKENKEEEKESKKGIMGREKNERKKHNERMGERTKY